MLIVEGRGEEPKEFIRRTLKVIKSVMKEAGIDIAFNDSR